MPADEPAAPDGTETPASAVTPADLRGLDSADAVEAAAVAAAIGAHLRDRERALAGADGEDESAGWSGQRWAYADRLARDRDRGIRIPATAPTDPWAAAGRSDRL